MAKKANNRSEDSYIVNDILPAFADYGYPVAGDTQNLKIKGDIKIRMGSSYKEPDVVFYAEGIPVLLVESKKEGKSRENAEEQAKSYIRNFPIERYSRDGRPPQYAAVTIGKKIFFYKYGRDITEHGGIIDRLEPITDVPTYDQLRKWYGLEETAIPKLSPRSFKDIFYQIIAAIDITAEGKITPNLVLQAVQLLYEFLKDQQNYVARFPYTNLDHHPDRQRWIRNLLRQYNWSELGMDIASQFREEIIRSFQGSAQLNQYITPWPVIVFMTQMVDVKPHDRVLDFECGSGGFLAAAVHSGVPLEGVRGIDIADLPYFVSKLFLSLNFNITGKNIDKVPVSCDNGLYFWGSNWSVILSNPAGGNKYDPNRELKDIEKVYENLERDLDGDGRDDLASEYNFSVQQAIRSAKVGGKICLVLPEGVFSNSSAEFLRKYVTKYCRVRAVISLPRGIFYKGTTTRSVQTGRTASQQKMSILYAEKVKEVVDGEGIEVCDDDLQYPVFLAAVQKTIMANDDPNWLEVVLSKVLEEYKTWESNNALMPNEEPVEFAKAKTIKAKDLIRKEENLFTKQEQKRSKPPVKEETIISEDLEDIF
jgi:hypothetical protein